jgi:hypothetical protein
MAKDDYDYLVFRILVYLYACLKRKCSYDSRTLARKVAGGDVQEDYFEDVLRMMQEEGLVSGLQFTQAWGREYLLVDGLEQLRITSAGIRYLLDNGKMQKIGKMVTEGAPGALLELVRLALFS